MSPVVPHIVGIASGCGIDARPAFQQLAVTLPRCAASTCRGGATGPGDLPAKVGTHSPVTRSKPDSPADKVVSATSFESKREIDLDAFRPRIAAAPCPEVPRPRSNRFRLFRALAPLRLVRRIACREQAKRRATSAMMSRSRTGGRHSRHHALPLPHVCPSQSGEGPIEVRRRSRKHPSSLDSPACLEIDGRRQEPARRCGRRPRSALRGDWR